MSIKAWNIAKLERIEAENYLSLIGKTTKRTTVAERYGEGATAGELTKFAVSTEINFQKVDGGQNYHRCKAFDEALSAILRRKWTEISAEAMDYIRKAEADAAKAAADDLRKMLSEVEAIL